MSTSGRVAQAFDRAGVKNIVGAPSFAHFAKGGNLKRMRDRVAKPQELCRQHRYKPLQKTQGPGTLNTDGAHRHHQGVGHAAKRANSKWNTVYLLRISVNPPAQDQQNFRAKNHSADRSSIRKVRPDRSNQS